jgi:hypothetical protein
VAAGIAFVKIGAGKGGQVAVAGTIDDATPEEGATAGFPFDQHRPDAGLAVHHHAGRQRVEQDIDAGGR